MGGKRAGSTWWQQQAATVARRGGTLLLSSGMDGLQLMIVLLEQADDVGQVKVFAYAEMGVPQDATCYVVIYGARGDVKPFHQLRLVYPVFVTGIGQRPGSNGGIGCGGGGFVLLHVTGLLQMDTGIKVPVK